jgi:hypothetical protein
MTSIAIPFQTRWPMRQTGEFTFIIDIPVGTGVPVLSPDFIADNHLSDKEIDKAECQVLQSIAILN